VVMEAARAIKPTMKTDAAFLGMSGARKTLIFLSFSLFLAIVQDWT